MKKLNCWEFSKCGREVNGAKSKALGVCPTAMAKHLDGVNSGENGGRACWAIEGTACEFLKQRRKLDKLARCVDCKFYLKVYVEEGHAFKNSAAIKCMTNDGSSFDQAG